MKTHYFNLKEHIKIPVGIRSDCKMAQCGYLRKETTEDKEKVTCKLCINEMRKQGIIK